MGLLTCPDCGRDVSDRARACPHCGCPITGDPEDSVFTRGRGLGDIVLMGPLVLLLFFLVYVFLWLGCNGR